MWYHEKLVCARDIEECGKRGKTEYCVDDDTIITPSAKDGEAYGIRFTDSISQRNQPKPMCLRDWIRWTPRDSASC